MTTSSVSFTKKVLLDPQQPPALQLNVEGAPMDPAVVLREGYLSALSCLRELQYGARTPFIFHGFENTE